MTCANSSVRRTLCGWARRSGAPARRWCHKGVPDTETSDEAVGRSRGGSSATIHLRAEGRGKPITFLVTAERREAAMFEPLMEQGAVKRAGPGRPRRRPRRIVGDTGSSIGTIRTYCHRYRVRVTIPRKRNERRRGPFDRTIYRQRNIVELFINRLKQFRSIATRYEKRAVNYAARLIIAPVLLWL